MCFGARDLSKKRYRKTLPSLERPVYVVAERELNPELRMEEEKEEDSFTEVSFSFTIILADPANSVPPNNQWTG